MALDWRYVCAVPLQLNFDISTPLDIGDDPTIWTFITRLGRYQGRVDVKLKGLHPERKQLRRCQRDHKKFDTQRNCGSRIETTNFKPNFFDRVKAVLD